MIDTGAIADLLKEVIESSGWCEHLAQRSTGRILPHQKFRAAVAGCPNACSEPQVRDFGVIGRLRPGRGEADCTQCLECESACRERALVVTDAPQIDPDLCVECGACLRACPTGTLVEGQTGYQVLVGGKLGRHPRLADTLLERTDEAGIRAAARATLELMKQEETRLGDILARDGLDSLLARLGPFAGREIGCGAAAESCT